MPAMWSPIEIADLARDPRRQRAALVSGDWSGSACSALLDQSRTASCTITCLIRALTAAEPPPRRGFLAELAPSDKPSPPDSNYARPQRHSHKTPQVDKTPLAHSMPPLAIKTEAPRFAWAFHGYVTQAHAPPE